MNNALIDDGTMTADKLRACCPYEDEHGKFLQLPGNLVFEHTLDNSAGTTYLSVPGLELGTPAGLDFLVYAYSAIVDQAYTYARIQWPDGLYLSSVPVDLWNMVGTGRNGRLLARPKFLPKGSVTRFELGTQQVAVVKVTVVLEGCVLVRQ